MKEVITNVKKRKKKITPLNLPFDDPLNSPRDIPSHTERGKRKGKKIQSNRSHQPT